MPAAPDLLIVLAYLFLGDGDWQPQLRLRHEAWRGAAGLTHARKLISYMQ
jgi:hypothetical protein